MRRRVPSRQRFAVAAGVILLPLIAPPFVQAGMPSVDLSDISRLRLEVISFFLMGILLSAAVIRAMWNGLRSEWPALPSLSYRGALSVTVLWGLLFLLVLTMISGARELMTPGAWKKVGLTYQLSPTTSPSGNDSAEQAANVVLRASLLLEQRRRGMEQLAHALERFASQHDGRYPSDPETSQISEAAWLLPELSGTRYIYLSGRTTGDGKKPVAYEPDLYGSPPLVLYADGEIRQQPLELTLAQVEATR